MCHYLLLLTIKITEIILHKTTLDHTVSYGIMEVDESLYTITGVYFQTLHLCPLLAHYIAMYFNTYVLFYGP